MRLFAIGLAIFLGGCVMTTGYSVPYLIQPPARYSHYVDHTIIEYTSGSEVNRVCRELLGRSGPYVGCAIPEEDGECTIHALRFWTVNFDLLIAHEMGHCAGWPADHPR